MQGGEGGQHGATGMDKMEENQVEFASNGVPCWK